MIFNEAGRIPKPRRPRFLKLHPGDSLSQVLLNQRRKPSKTLQEYQEENIRRKDTIVAGYQSNGYTMDDIAEYFGCHDSTVSRMVAEFKTRPLFVPFFYGIE